MSLLFPSRDDQLYSHIASASQLHKLWVLSTWASLAFLYRGHFVCVPSSCCAQGPGSSLALAPRP